MERKRGAARNDIILIAVILVIAAVLLLVLWRYRSGQTEAGYAVVTVDGEEYMRYALDTDTTDVIETEYGTNYLEIRDGTANMTDADCPDRICVDMGSISKAGETIVCLPHRLVVEIEEAQGAEFDTIAQ